MYLSAYNRVCQCPSKIVGITPLPRQSADLLPIPRGKFIISFIMTSTNPPSASHISYTIPGTPPASVPPKPTHPPLLPPLELPTSVLLSPAPEHHAHCSFNPVPSFKINSVAICIFSGIASAAVFTFPAFRLTALNATRYAWSKVSLFPSTR